MTLRDVSVGQTVKVTRLMVMVRLREELWIWELLRELKSM